MADVRRRDAAYLRLSRCFDELSPPPSGTAGRRAPAMFVEIMARAAGRVGGGVPHVRQVRGEARGGQRARGGRRDGGRAAIAGDGGDVQTDGGAHERRARGPGRRRRVEATAGDVGRLKPLTVRRVLETLRAIASEKGAGSAGRKKDLVLGLMRAAREGEIRWLTRTLIRNMRIGANKISVLHALASASEEHHSRRTGTLRVSHLISR